VTPDEQVPDYQPYLAGPFRWRLGLRPLDVEDWIQIGPDYDQEMARKRDVLERAHPTVVAVLPDIEPEAQEVLGHLVHHLCRRWPQWFSVDRGVVTNHRTGETFQLADDPLHPLDIAGRLVQEDLALLVPRAGGLVFGGGSVCFPNRWDLPSKIGRTLAEVHAPVAQLNEQLATPIDGFFERLAPERSYWRLGWGVLDTDDPYQPVDGTAAARPGLPDAAEVADRTFLRVERETIRRFAVTGVVLFTIRTYIRPLAHLAERTDDAARLAEALAAFPADVADYKQLDDLGPLVRGWLEQVAHGA
jgi:dimethylamine monooxygenase subunit A